MAYQFAMNVMFGWVLVTVGVCNRNVELKLILITAEKSLWLTTHY